MAKKEKHPPAAVVAALKECDGMVYLAADKLGVAASTIYRCAERHAAVKEAIEHSKGVRLDTAESKLWQAVLDREAWAVCFYLKTQGKARGYVERQEIEATNKTTLEVVEEIVDAPRKDSPSAPEAK